MKAKKVWVLSVQKTLSEEQKQAVATMFEPLIDRYKKKYIVLKPNKNENYIVDFYTKWYRGFFYLCVKYKAEYKNRTLDEFEEKFARLEYVDENKYNLAYFRHTQQWWTIYSSVTVEFCLKTIEDNSLFFSYYQLSMVR